MLCHRRKSALVLAQLRKNALFLFLCISFYQYLNRILEPDGVVKIVEYPGQHTSHNRL